MPRESLIQYRRGTAAEWTAANPILAAGEVGFETDTGILKTGDGTTAWGSLDYIGSGSFTGSETDALLSTVNSSNLSATHKITRSATLVIAAADSSAKSKAQADYVCDGTDDDTTIQTALNSLPAEGGLVFFLAGTYNISSPIFIQSYTTILGEGEATKFYLMSGSNCPMLINSDWDNSSGGNTGIHLMNFQFDGNKANNTEASTYTGLDYSWAIKFSYVTNSSCLNLRGTMTPACAITISDYSSYVDVCNCVIDNTYSDGISADLFSNNILIDGNTLIGPGIDGAPCGVELQDGASKIIVTNNKITGWIQEAVRVYVHAFGEAVHDVAISNNTMTTMANWPNISITGRADGQQDNYNIGVYNNILKMVGTTTSKIACDIQSSNYVSFENNLVSYDTYNNDIGTGVYLKDVDHISVCDNMFNQCAYKGVEVNTGVSYFKINNNIFNRSRIGIYHLNTMTPHPTYGEIYDNIFSNASTAAIGSEFFTYDYDVRIRGNIGCVSENTGTATITAGQTAVDVTHGLAAAPTRVILSPTTATGGKDYYVSAKGATTFAITIDSAAGSDISFDWQAVI